MRIRSRDSRDPSGRVVDVYTLELITARVFSQNCKVTDDDLRKIAIETFRKLRSSTNRRVRERELTIFSCRWTAYHGEDFVALGTQTSLGYGAWLCLQASIPAQFEVVESSEAFYDDVNAVPIARYSHGNTIFYVDPFEEVTSPVLKVEYRSFSLRERPQHRSPGFKLATVRTAPPEQHRLESWNEIKRDAFHLIASMPYPAKYVELRRQVKRQLGIPTHEVDASLSGRYGCISVEWIGPDGGCNIKIHINRELPAEIKYVVLAHELGHYITQFPILYLAQLVEQCSWFNPAIELFYQRAFSVAFPDPSIIEDQANRVASLALVSEAYANTFKVVFETYRQPTRDHEVWKWLQHFFPETRNNSDYRTWKGWGERLKREEEEISRAKKVTASTAGNLYEMMLSAVLRRDEEEIVERYEQAHKATQELVSSYRSVVYSALTKTPAPADQSDGTSPYLPDKPSTARQLITPPNGSSYTSTRIPLISATGRPRDLWRCPLLQRSPVLSVQQWQEELPESALVLYRLKGRPPFDLNFNPIPFQIGIDKDNE